MPRDPIIIVGAARSGTKLLRKLVAFHPDMVPFAREINYIWRHGNVSFPTDELTRAQATERVCNYIRRRFQRLSEQAGGKTVIEKTCASSLRIEFVRLVFPQARILHLVRDGRAVTESARRRWRAKPEPSYLLEKARLMPVWDLPFYVLRYAKFQCGWLMSGRKNRAQLSWGPRFSGIDTVVRTRPLTEVCALQWRACIRSIRKGLCNDPLTLTLRYEDLVSQPLREVDRILTFIQEERPPGLTEFLQKEVSNEHLNKWRDRLRPDEIESLTELIGLELAELGYVS